MLLIFIAGSSIADPTGHMPLDASLNKKKVEEKIEARRVVVFYSHGIDRFFDMNHDDQWVDAIQSEDVNFQVKKYFLKNNQDISQEAIKKRAKKMWEQGLKFKPELIVCYNNEVWSVLKEEIKAAAKSGILIGLFDIYLHHELAEEFIADDIPKMMIGYYKIRLELFYEHLAKNGVSLDNYYIIRDRSTESYWADLELRNEITKHNPKAEIITKTAQTIQDLRTIVFESQIKERGYLIALSHGLYNVETKEYDSESQVMQEIVKSNRRHIEISLMSNRMKDGATFSSFHLHNTCRQNVRKYQNVLKSFLQEYNGENRVLIELTPRLTMNGKRVNDLGVENLTKDLSLIHCLGDSY